MRVVLDQLFQDFWYNHLDKKSDAYRQLTSKQLVVAIELAKSIADSGEIVLNAWNQQSLSCRSWNSNPVMGQKLEEISC